MILVRADGNAKIGVGHLMRCLTIMEAYVEIDSRDEVLFVCADEMSAAVAEEHGFKARVLGTDYRDMESELPGWRKLVAEVTGFCSSVHGCGLEEVQGEEGYVRGAEVHEAEGHVHDAEGEVLEAAGHVREAKVHGAEGRVHEAKVHVLDAEEVYVADADVLAGQKQKSAGITILVDGYHVTSDYLTSLREFGRVVLLDDMQQQAFPADVVINYNIFADEEVYQSLYQGTETQLCLGGRYVPVRKQFRQVEYELAKEVRHILITTGGGDKDNIAGAILEKICEQVHCDAVKVSTERGLPERRMTGNVQAEKAEAAGGTEMQYHLVLGQFNPHKQEMEQLSERCPNVHLHVNVKDMAGLMKSSDVAITAGGSTIYELAAIGVPFICFSYAENQEALTSYIGEKEIAYFAGAYHKTPEETLTKIKEMVTALCGEYSIRQRLSRKEKTLIDGEGARRVAEVLRKCLN